MSALAERKCKACEGGIPALSRGEAEKLLKELAAGLGRSLPLVPIPGPALRFLARVAGLQFQFNRMTSSLRVDASKARRVLAWQPRVGLHAAIGSMAAAYLRERRG